MTRAAFDSNILLYAELEPGSARGARSQRLLVRGVGKAILPVQVLGEFLNAMRRKSAATIDVTLSQINRYASYFETPQTSVAIVKTAGVLSRDHGLQVWDAIVVAAASGAGASILLSEDMQDGRHIAGLQILNPFNVGNDTAIDALLPP